MSSLRSRFDRLRVFAGRAWRILFLTGKMALALVLSPLLLLDKALRWLAPRPSQDQPGIPSRNEMRELEPFIGRGDKRALRRWLRGAFFYELIGKHGVTPEMAAEQAEELAQLANSPGGYSVTVEQSGG